MTPHYSDDWLTVYHGDARAVMAELPAESVHCVVTSPPYWGLRDYGTASWIGGGDPECDHKKPAVAGRATDFKERGERRGYNPGSNFANYGERNATATDFDRVCGKCGAIRQDSQLGLEPTPEQYVENMVAVFREVRRVLRSDGTVWLNLGDSYANGPPSGTAGQWNGSSPLGKGRNAEASVKALQQVQRPPGLKPKDLVGIPWRVAFALQADGWYLRSDIIWSKPNPMPESVTDRPTKSHEYLFLLSKSARYYYDADAVREAADYGRFSGGYPGSGRGPLDAPRGDGTKAPTGENAGRNLRSVWSIATAPYPGAHFATFPPKLVEPCIKAGTSEKGVCPECGAPWVRVVERTGRVLASDGRDQYGAYDARRPRGEPTGPQHQSGEGGTASMPRIERIAVGWRHRCLSLDPQPVPATVLDPFAGSGTTGMVAQSLSRRAILIDLSLDYLGQLMDRNREVPLGL